MDKWNPQNEDFCNRGFNPNIGGRNGKAEFSLYVINIPMELSEMGVKNLFGTCGEVRTVKFLPLKLPHQNGRAGFVNYSTLREAEKAIANLNNFRVGDLSLKVQWAKQRREIPPKVDDEKYLTLLQKLELGPLIEEDLNDLIRKVDNGSFRNPLLKSNGGGCDQDEPRDSNENPAKLWCATQFIDEKNGGKSKGKTKQKIDKPDILNPESIAQELEDTLPKLLPLMKRFKSGDKVPLTVVEVAPKDGTFICQLDNPKDKEKMEKLHIDLNHHFAVSEKTLIVRHIVGMVCATVYSEDGNWYRVVLEDLLDNNKAKIKYLDHGNVEAVQLTSLYKLEEFFYETPAFSIPCKLKGLQSWSDDVSKLIVSAVMQNDFKVVACVHTIKDEIMIGDILVRGVSMLEMLSTKTDVCILEKTLPVASPKTSDTSVTDSSAEKPDCEKLETPQPQQSVSSHMDSCEVIKTNKEPAKLKLPDGVFHVMVSHVNSPDSFFCQIIQESLFEFVQQMENISDGKILKPLNEPPKIGQVCAALYQKENAWNRTEVLECVDDNVKVLFIDYGNVEMVPTSLLKLLPLELREMPKQAFEACLVKGKENKLTTQSIAKFKKFENSVCLATVVKTDQATGKVILDLKTESNESIDDIIKEEKVVLVLAKTIPPKLPLMDVELKVYVTAADQSGVIYCQLANDIQKYTDMNTKMVQCFEKDRRCLSGEALSPGIACAVGSKNGHWFRAVVSQVAEKQVLVKYLDFGCSAQVNRSQVFQLPTMFCSESVFTVPCRLLDAKPVGQEDWGDDFVVVCREVKGKTLKAKFVSKVGDNYVAKIPQLLNMLIMRKCVEYC